MHRGLRSWNDFDEAWEHRANEHAAEITTWGVIDQPMRFDPRIENAGCDEMAEAYRLLTGSEPENGLAFDCRK